MVETIAVVTRLVVLLGAVSFAFLLLVYGFAMVRHEYSLVKSFAKLKEFIELTARSGLEADVAKGTISLNRARPGILMIAVGALVLVVCLLQRFDYSIAERVRQSSSVEAPHDVCQGQVLKRVAMTNINEPAEITVAQIENLRRRVLDQWLSVAGELVGKSLSDQLSLLEDRFGSGMASRVSFYHEETASREQLAEIAFDDKKYAPLISAFNPHLIQEPGKVPAFTCINILQPLQQEVQSVVLREKRVSIASPDPKAPYEYLLRNVEKIVDSNEFERGPTAWWAQRGQDVTALADAMSIQFGMKWGAQFYQVGPGETPTILAKIHYGDARFAKLIVFLNPKLAEAMAKPEPLPEGTVLTIIKCSDYPG